MDGLQGHYAKRNKSDRERQCWKPLPRLLEGRIADFQELRSKGSEELLIKGYKLLVIR